MKFKLKIGETELCHALMLAPLAGYTDAAFRIICAGQGAEYAVSEMISAKAVCYGDKKTLMIAAIPENSPPTAFQLFGCEPAFMASAAKELSSDAFAQKNGGRKPAAIDINMGCPVRKIVSNGEGSALMKNPSLAARIIEAVANAVTIPVTVKIRSGWDSEHINAPQIARLAQSAGASAVCVHPRTRVSICSAMTGFRYSCAVSLVTGWSNHPSSTRGTKSGQAWEKTRISGSYRFIARA